MSLIVLNYLLKKVDDVSEEKILLDEKEIGFKKQNEFCPKLFMKYFALQQI